LLKSIVEVGDSDLVLGVAYKDGGVGDLDKAL